MADQRRFFDLEERYTAHSGVRVVIEHVFADSSHRMVLFVRTIEIANLACTIKRLVWLKRLAEAQRRASPERPASDAARAQRRPASSRSAFRAGQNGATRQRNSRRG